MARWTSRAAIAGALIQIGYGLLACVYRYPAISDRSFEALWAAANLGMIANIVTWLSIKVATRRLALVGGVLAIAGHAFRVVISLIIQARPDAGAPVLQPHQRVSPLHEICVGPAAPGMTSLTRCTTAKARANAS